MYVVEIYVLILSRNEYITNTDLFVFCDSTIEEHEIGIHAFGCYWYIIVVTVKYTYEGAIM